MKRRIQRITGAAVACSLLLGAFVSSLYASSLVISDTPMAVKNTVKSNIMFTIDSSGGTDVDMLLPTFNSMYYENGVTPTLDPTNLNGHFFLFPLTYRNVIPPGGLSPMLEGDVASPDTAHWRVRNYQYNLQYYNPFNVYKPWTGTDITGAAFTDANPAAIKLDPYGNALGTIDLTKAISSGSANISGISKANPGVVTTSAAHGFTTGQSLLMTGVGGMTQVNNNLYTITVLSSTTFSLGLSTAAGVTAVNTSSGYSTYSSGGTAQSNMAHTFLSTGATPTDITASGGRYYGSTWFPAVYYTWNDANGDGVMDVSEGVRYEIKDPSTCPAATGTSSNGTSAIIPGCGGAASAYPSGRTYAAELQNFANWFQYARTPLLTLQGSIGKQLETLGSTRVGMIYLEKDISDAKSSPVEDMTCNVKSTSAGGVPCTNPGTGNLNNLRNKLYDLNANLTDWRQPIHERMSHVFNYFKQTGTVNGVAAPIQGNVPSAALNAGRCQQNFNIIATPGYLNENGGTATGFKNYFTGVTPSSPFPVGDYDSTGSGKGAQTVPYDDSSNPGTGASYSDTLADWALYIYNQNLRADLATGQVPLTPGSHEDNANPHLTTYVIAPGAVPTLGNAPLFLDPATADPYTLIPPIDWPQPVFVDQSTVDDLWHATVNGRGSFINNTDIYGGLSTILNDIMGRSGAAAAVAVSNANVSPGDNFSYSSSYNSGNWSGDLQSTPISLTTGLPDLTNPQWTPSVGDQLDTLVTVSSRLIATYDGSKGIPFEWASLTAAQQSLLNSPVSPPGMADGANVLSFLRGNRLKEGTVYRTRGHVLGDIINAEPLIVREPVFSYADAGYLDFKTRYTNTTPRAKMVYQPANDGLVHAFDALTGAERWAYIPGLLFDSRMTSAVPTSFPNTSTLANLSLRNGFKHLYMADGSPVSGDVDFGNTQGATSHTPAWRTLMVGGLRKGGRGYYALDVTDPTATDEAAVASKALWEFPANSGMTATQKLNVGYSYGKPIIVKTKAAGWVVLVTSGYNNGTDDSASNTGGSGTGGDGQGHLFVLNAKTGALIKDINTGAGNAGTPSGLAQLAAFVNNSNIDKTVTQVYGGDLNGNVWRFDLSDQNSTSNWSVSKLATLVDASGTAQPVTTIPQLTLAGSNHMIYVGTGKYLGDADVPPVPAVAGLPSTQVQTMYGLVDDNSGNSIFPLRSNLQQQTILTSGATRTVSANATGSKKGWYLDLTFAGDPLGERVFTNPKLVYTTLTFTTNTPDASDPCNPGGVNPMLYTLDYANGGQIAGATSAIIRLGTTSLVSDPQLVMLPNGTIDAVIRKSDATTVTPNVSTTVGTTAVGKRVSWREIVQ